MCIFCRSFFVLLSFLFWPLWCLSFFDLRILITPLVSSNSSSVTEELSIRWVSASHLYKCKGYYWHSKSASHLDLYIGIANGILKAKLYHKRDDFIFQIVSFLFIICNIPTSPANVVYFSQLLRYLEPVPSTTIFWKELSYWRKSYSNENMLLLAWRPRYKKYTVVIRNWLTVI